MARQFFNVEVQVGERVYRAHGDATARDANPKAVAQRRAFAKIMQVFPETGPTGAHAFHVVSVTETTSPWQTQRIATDEENAASWRDAVMWMLRQKIALDPELLLAEKIARYRGDVAPVDGASYAFVAEALAWVGQKVMRLDVERAFAAAILRDVEAAGALEEGWTTSDSETFQHPVVDPAKFDEVVARWKKEMLNRALQEDTHGGPFHDVLDRVRREVAGRVYLFLEGRDSWL